MRVENEETTSKSIVKYDYTRFPKFFSEFKRSEYWKSMEATVEDSPWHREKNVAVHTEMSLEQAERWFKPDASDRHKLLTKLAILFHDTGKPPMEVEKTSEERGVYRSYANHEQRSARIFEGFMFDNWAEMKDWIDMVDVYTVAWIIEHHLPYGLKNQNKIDALVKSLVGLPRNEDIAIFFNSLLGDAHGRTSDNYTENTKNVVEWVEDMTARVLAMPANTIRREDFKGEVLMLVGPPGVGKSTVRDHLIKTQKQLFEYSLDDDRLMYAAMMHPQEYDALPTEAARYQFAFRVATDEEKAFGIFTEANLKKVFERGNQGLIVIDNTNVSIKQRRKYIELANQNKMYHWAIYFPSSMKFLLERNEKRGDKKLPHGALQNLFHAVAMPSAYGELHNVAMFTESMDNAAKG